MKKLMVMNQLQNIGCVEENISIYELKAIVWQEQE